MAAAPELAGYELQREIGSGGFADVYLYRQLRPSRDVAVKVLRSVTVDDLDRAGVDAEANRMALLSTHPSILTIYEVGVAADGRAYLTMEHCPRGSFGELAQASPLTIGRALQVGVKVAAAVETAHRAGIVHRDIKPANVLVTAYGEPALTDFGIAAGGEGATGDGGFGVSLHFAAPEVIAGRTAGDERSDVYSLGATVYALLAGRSPYSGPDVTTEHQLVQRTLHASLPPVGRDDVPASLERALATALARSADARFGSAAALGRALQSVEVELGLPPTALVVDDAPLAAPRPGGPGDGDSTRATTLQRVDPDGPPAPDPEAEPWRDRAGPAAAGPVGALGDRTVGRPVPRAAPTAPEAPPPSRPGAGRIAALVVAGVVVVGAVGFVLAQAGGGPEGSPSSTTVDGGELVVGGAPAGPEDVRIERLDAGGQLVTWRAPGAEEGDTYQVFLTVRPTGEDRLQTTTEPELRLASDQLLCLTVETVRAGRVSAASTEACSP